MNARPEWLRPHLDLIERARSLIALTAECLPEGNDRRRLEDAEKCLAEARKPIAVPNGEER